MARRTFEVQDIRCKSCSAAIRKELGRLTGVTEVEPDEGTNTVVVSFTESEVNPEAIAGRLAEAGFSVKDSTQNERTAAPNAAKTAGRWLPYGLLTLAVVVTALAGYAGYELYPRFDLPAVDGPGLLALAAGAGIASFFAPCSFPLLVTLLSRQVGGAGRATKAGGRPLPFALALAAGAAGFLVLFGALVALGGGAFAGSVTFTSTVGIALRITVGAGLITLGLIQLGVLAGTSFRSVEHVTKRLDRAQAGLRRRHPVTGFAAFGFFYLLAGFG
ncbi:MAG: cation transporter [Actinobacteria bacterium]|nr:cation transporter [Actinomycetota bacterium]